MGDGMKKSEVKSAPAQVEGGKVEGTQPILISSRVYV
jgi:hypothetical protein